MNWKRHEALVVDVETTSKYPTQESIRSDRRAPRDAHPARVIQLGTCIAEPGDTIDDLPTTKAGSAWINPGMDVPADVIDAIHLTADELNHIRSDPPFSHFARRLVDSMNRRGLVIGYNILSYDGPVLDREIATCGLFDENALPVTFPDVPIIDVLILARNMLVDAGLENYKLGTVANHFGIEADGAHRAGADCLMTWRILERLMPDLPDDLDELLAAQELWREFGNFWAIRLDGSLGLNCLSKKNPGLKRGMSPEQVINLDDGFYGWTYKMVGDRARQLLPAF